MGRASGVRLAATVKLLDIASLSSHSRWSAEFAQSFSIRLAEEIA